MVFPFFKKSQLVATFDGGQVVTDSGLLLVRQFDDAIGFTKAISDVIIDPRNQFFIVHPQVELLRQRIYQIIAGYEDANDATVLRHDPVFKSIAGKRPLDIPLASQPTLCRLENRVGTDTCWDVAEVFVTRFTQTRRRPKRLILEMDPTDAPTHGQQQLTFFNAFYDEHMYFPILLVDAESGCILAPVLRPGNAGSTEEAYRILSRVVELLRQRWPGIPIEFRADSNFATQELMDWLESERIPYAVGIGKNDVLKRLSAPFVKAVEDRFAATGQPQRSFTSIRYAAKTWPHRRRVVVKCEVTPLGTNVRYVVTTKGGRSEDLYAYYVKRGGTIEHFIDELKNGFEGDRLSCQAFSANYFRLLLASAAYNLMLFFREHARVPAIADATIETLRLKVIKVGGVVRQTVRRVWFDLSSTWPFEPIFRELYSRLLPEPYG